MMGRRGQRMPEICSDEDDRVGNNLVSPPTRTNSKRFIDEEERRIRIARGEEKATAEDEEMKAKAIASKNKKNIDKSPEDSKKTNKEAKRASTQRFPREEGEEVEGINTAASKKSKKKDKNPGDLNLWKSSSGIKQQPRDDDEEDANDNRNPGELRKGRTNRRNNDQPRRGRRRRHRAKRSPSSTNNESTSNYTEQTFPGAYPVSSSSLRVSHASAGEPNVVYESQNREEEEENTSTTYLPDDPILEATKVDDDIDVENCSANNDDAEIIPTVAAERDTALAFLKRSRCLQMTLFIGCFAIVGLVLGVSLALFNRAITETPTTTTPSEPQEDEFFHQLGSSIDGPIEDGRFGLSIALKGDSTNGYKMAVADFQEVFVYELQQQQIAEQTTTSSSSRSFDWNLTSTIVFPSNATAGRNDIQISNSNGIVLDAVNVYMSQDGNHLAVGWPYSPTEDGSKSSAGRVQVYQYLAGDKKWEQYGNALYGMSSEDFFGTSVTLNANAQYLGVGSPGSEGSAFVFEFVDGVWIRRGNIGRMINGTLAVGSISMSSTGTRVAVGGYPTSVRGGVESEMSTTSTVPAVVRIFSFISGDWVELGQGIEGHWYSLHGTAYITELSAARGDVVALSNYYMGESIPAENEMNDALDVRVYKWEEENNDWVQLGENIHAFEPGEKAGYFISLSDDGKMIFMGDPGRRSDEGGGEAGHVHMYVYNSESEHFVPLGPDRDGEAAGDNFGTAVAMSGDGKVFAASAPFNRGQGKELGRLYAFSIDGVDVNA